MKKFIALFLSLIISLVLFGCNSSESSGENIDPNISSDVEIIVSDKTVKLSKQDAEEITEILENGKWIDDLTNCASDCRLVISGNTITYHSECGTFNDSQNQRSLATDKDVKKLINSILEQYVTLG